MSDILNELRNLIPDLPTTPMSGLIEKISSLKIGDFLTAESSQMLDFCSDKFNQAIESIKISEDPSIEEVETGIKKLADMAEKISSTLEKAGDIETVQDAIDLGLVKQGETVNATEFLNRLFQLTTKEVPDV